MPEPVSLLLARIQRLVDRGELSGPDNLVVHAFEQAMSRTAGTTHAIGTVSGTIALELVLEASGIGPGDEVIVPALSAFGTLAAIVRRGATPRVVDVDPNRLTLSPTAMAAALSEHTKAAIAVHVMGISPDIDALRVMLGETLLVEDASQGFPGLVRADVAFASLSQGKPYDIGEGGVVLTDSEDLAVAVRWLTCLGHGGVPAEGGPIDWSVGHLMVGTSARMPGLQAALGLYRAETVDAHLSELRHVWTDLRAAGLAAGLEPLADPALPLAALFHGQLDAAVPLERPLMVGPAHREPALAPHVAVDPTPVADDLDGEIVALATDTGNPDALATTLANLAAA